MNNEYIIINAYIKNVCKGINSRRIKREVTDELFSHMMETYERNIALGMSDDEAQKDAVSRMGDEDAVAKTFKQLYPVPTLAFLEETTSSLAGGIALSSFWWVLGFGEQTEGLCRLIMFVSVMIPLFYFKKANKYFTASFYFCILNWFLVSAGFWLHDYFVGDVTSRYVLLLVEFVFRCVTYALIFCGIRAVEKQVNDKKTVSNSPVLHIFLITASQFLCFLSATSAELMMELIFLGLAFAVAIFSLIKIYDSASLLDAIDLQAPQVKIKSRKYYLYRAALATILVALSLLSTVSIVCRPAKTIDYVTQDVVVESNVAEIRENMIALGLSQEIAYDLPDSEVEKYLGAERMEIKDAEDETFNDIDNMAYAFYFPGTDSIPHRARVLLIIDSFEEFEKIRRDGIYLWGQSYGGNSEYAHNLDFYHGSFGQVLCDINGKTKKIIPFAQYDLESSDGLELPVGFEFSVPENAENVRLYFSQTYVLDEEVEGLVIGYNYYRNESLLTYQNTFYANYCYEFKEEYGLGYRYPLRAWFEYNPAYLSK